VGSNRKGSEKSQKNGLPTRKRLTRFPNSLPQRGLRRKSSGKAEKKKANLKSKQEKKTEDRIIAPDACMEMSGRQMKSENSG